MPKDLFIEIPGNIELKVSNYEELMTLIYLTGHENIAQALKSFLASLIESDCSKVINGKTAERNEILRRLSNSFMKLNVTPIVILEEE